MLHSLGIYLLLVGLAVSNCSQFALFSQPPDPTYQFLEASKAGNAFEAYQLSKMVPISFTSSYLTNGPQNLPPQPIFFNSPTPKAAETPSTTVEPITTKGLTSTQVPTTTPGKTILSSTVKPTSHVEKDHSHAEHHKIITPTTLNQEQQKEFAERILHDLEDLSSRMCVLCFMV